jgi:hypothetical protein
MKAHGVRIRTRDFPTRSAKMTHQKPSKIYLQFFVKKAMLMRLLDS